MLLLTGSIANETGLRHLPMGEAGIYALLGYGVVFLGLVLLMIVVMIMGKSFAAAEKRQAAKAAPITETITPEAPRPEAPGTAGQVKLHGVEPKTAAMLMAIVADKLGKPINELRFISIKEVE